MKLGKEEIFARESESRQMQFTREQQATQMAMRDDLQIDMFNERQKELVIWQQDIAEETLIQLAYELRNQYYDPEAKKWCQRIEYYDKNNKPVYMKPLLNEIGIQKIVSIVRPLLSRNMINTNLNDDQISKMLIRTVVTTVLNLSHNFDTWGLGEEPNISTLDQIVDMVLNYIIPTPYRALNDGERKHLRSFSRRIETLSENPPQIKQRKTLGLF